MTATKGAKERTLVKGEVVDLRIIGYDKEGEGYGLHAGSRVTVEASRLNDLLNVEILDTRGGLLKASIVSILERRTVRDEDPPFSESELDQIERSIARGRYKFSKKLGVYYAFQDVRILGVDGKNRFIFTKIKPDDREYEANLTNDLGQPVEQLIADAYSSLSDR